jgi:hypothetical protein
VPPIANVLDETIETLADLLRAPVVTSQKMFNGQMSCKLHSLATRAAIPPDIPILAEPLLLALASDLRTRDALVVTVVPLADVFSNLDAGTAGVAASLLAGAVGLPRQGFLEAEVQELKGALGALAGGDVAVEG